MKLLLAAREGEAYFNLLDDVPNLEIVRATSPAEALERAADVDVYFGFPSEDLLKAAPRLRWIQTPSAGADFLWRMPALVDSEVILTNTLPIEDGKQFPELRVLSIAPIIADALDAVFEDTSVSQIFEGDNL